MENKNQLTYFLIRIVLVLVAPILVSLYTYKQVKYYFIDALDPSNTQKMLVEIQTGSSFRDISKLLESKKLIRRHWSLEVVARLKRNEKMIMAGEYEIAASMSPTEILKKLVSGDIYKRKVTLIPGSSVWDIGQEVENAGLMKKVDFDKAIADPGLLGQAGINAKTFEGYLLPETYFFSRPIDAKKIIWTMLEASEKSWPAQYSSRSEIMGLSRHQVITLASIIEKESGKLAEQPVISSVFHNRLKQGMKLQSDPTVVYGLPNFNGNITKRDLENDHPYNTYMHFGLPPGPICNPSLEAIKAALFPEETQYLFFVADGKGAHVFSTTLREHNRAVDEYRKIVGARAPLPQQQMQLDKDSGLSEEDIQRELERDLGLSEEDLLDGAKDL